MTGNIVIAVSRTYRRIDVYETHNGFEIIGADNKVYPFGTYSEACAFIDAWYAMQYVLAN